MLDILLDKSGDLSLSEDGDIRVGYSIPQAVLVSLRWIEDEWRFGPEIGFPWLTQVFTKNPNLRLIAQYIRRTIMEVDGVTKAKVDITEYDPRHRSLTVHYWVETEDETYEEEVILGG